MITRVLAFLLLAGCVEQGGVEFGKAVKPEEIVDRVWVVRICDRGDEIACLHVNGYHGASCVYLGRACSTDGGAP